MNCEPIRTELTGFHFNTLDADTRLAVEAHLPTCRACLDEFLALKRAVEVTDDAPMPSPASRARLRRAVADELRGPRPAPTWSWWERPLAFGLAAACVTLALGALHAVSSGPGARPRSVAAETP
jgi:anti-sigma factor RsiW